MKNADPRRIGHRIRILGYLLTLSLASATLMGCATGATLPPATGGGHVLNSQLGWASNDAQFFRQNETALTRAARAVVATVGPDSGMNSFVELPTDASTLSRRGAVWFVPSDSGTTNYVFFDNGGSDFPCADGLVYSTSATSPPPSEIVLSSPVRVAPGWWAVAWDPLLFGSDAFGYDGSIGGGDDALYLTRAAQLSGETTTVSGVVVAEVSWSLSGDLIEFVGSSGGKPVPVVLNRYTRISWPHGWGKISAPGADRPDVLLPVHAPQSLTGQRMEAAVKYRDLPNGRRQAFASRASFIAQ